MAAKKNETELERLSREAQEAQTKANTATQTYENAVNKGYTESDEVKALKNESESQYGELKNYSPYTNPNEAALSSALSAIVNRPAFSFSTDGDALYERYKNNYQAMGRQAMEDTVGTASSLTGGYGNSYATTAGAQAYNDYLSKMDDVIPTLYELALSKYSTEGDALADKYNALRTDDSDRYTRWQNDRSYAADLYDRAYDRYTGARSNDYSQYSDRLSGLYSAAGLYSDLWGNSSTALSNQRSYEQTEADNEYTRAYNALALGDGTLMSEWYSKNGYGYKSPDEFVTAYNAANYTSSGSSGGGGGGSYRTTGGGTEDEVEKVGYSGLSKTDQNKLNAMAEAGNTEGIVRWLNSLENTTGKDYDAVYDDLLTLYPGLDFDNLSDGKVYDIQFMDGAKTVRLKLHNGETWTSSNGTQYVMVDGKLKKKSGQTTKTSKTKMTGQQA